MSSSLGSLLTSRRFAPLFVTQFLGAFNDNLLKNALGIYVIFVLVTGTGAEAGVDIGGRRLAAATLVLLAQALFIAPFFLFSGVSGTLADRVDKAVIARWVWSRDRHHGGGLRPVADTAVHLRWRRCSPGTHSTVGPSNAPAAPAPATRSWSPATP